MTKGESLAFVKGDWISICGNYHTRIIRERKGAPDRLDVCAHYIWQPLEDKANGNISIAELLKGFVPKTQIGKILFAKRKKDMK